jgi:hypothetical protein
MAHHIFDLFGQRPISSKKRVGFPFFFLHLEVYLSTKVSHNNANIHLAKNQVHHARTKHIDIRFHFIREIIGNGEISLQKVDTKENPADMLTKIVPTIKFNHCLDLINILHV